MNDQNQDDGLESTSRNTDEPATHDTAASPVGSLTSHSSSSRQEHRIIELLPGMRKNNDSPQDENWMIGEEFYDEDVVAEDHPMAEDDQSYNSDESIEDDDNEIENLDGPDSDEHDYDGFIVAPYDPQSDSDTNDDNVVANYDTTLPISHRYLGENLEESRGRQILVDNSVITLPLINMRHIVLLPGQVLPITTGNLNPRIYMYLNACIANGTSMLGLMSDPRENPVGTTAEIRSYSRQEEELAIIMEGRQKFKLLSHPFETATEGTVKILPEISLGRPYSLTPSRRKFLSSNISVCNSSLLIVSKHPRWLLRQYEALYIVKKILDQIKDWCNVPPTDNPNDFSYWVAANLPISNQERMKVLKFTCTEGRLLWLLHLLEKCEQFACSCKNVICHKKDVFPMSCSGPQNSYVNSNGFVHDTLTVRAARGLTREYEWSSEFCWFPGYEWKIACCQNCSRHIGWCYRSIKPEVKPNRFYGLSRANVRLQSNDQVTQEEMIYVPIRGV